LDLDHRWHLAEPIFQLESNCEFLAAWKPKRVAGDPDPALVDEPTCEGLAVLQKGLEHVLSGWSSVDAYLILDGVMVFGDRWQIFRVSLRHGCRAIPIAWTIVEGNGLVKVNKLKSMLEKVQRFMKRYVKQVTLLADAGFRDCDWAQLCEELGWNYAIRIACNTYITLPDGTSDRLDNLVPVNRNRYFQNVLLTRETKLQTNVSVTWTTDSKGQPEMVAIITNQMLAGLACESTAFA
jgi:hypothetical protein